ncbi:hypothetical protein RHOM_02165 [Roseburia hominis A2-183]|uniref:Uncharacterized protein n=1 Tax=Roseburia hominis (strain DSM 16839 / JCM 17582 / NCIMB 14029 / A2-183) TaxID=585394 RepID=G2T1R1_ROSHA|nr:hypothetical protein [Roseburia hominis]AEN95555.1 hypothetical protein RHOM_02165 [Roseburia hominis A2-183]
MKWKKLVTLGCVVVMTVSSVTACGSNTTENQTVEATEQSEENQSDSVIVQVTAVEGDQITADVGTLTTASADASGNGAPGGEAPSGEAPGGDDSGNGAPGEAPGGEAPSGEAPGGDDSGNGAPGEAPSGEAPGGEAPSGDNSGNGAPGEAPSGDALGGQMPGGSSFEASGESITFTLTDDTAITLEYLQGSGEGNADDIAVGSVLEVVLDEDNQAVSVTVRNLNAGGGFGGSGEVTNGTSANTITEDTEVDSETYTSTGDDENALRVDGATVTLKDITIEKTAGSSSNTEDGDFYGLNAGLLVLNGATATITGATVNTSVTNGNGVFSYGEGTVVNISDSTIRTTENNSGGIQTTGGGTMNAANLDVETQGNSAAAIRSDRGGGTVNVDGGSYVTNGTGSPAIYCTAGISVSDATLTANASEGVVVEGKNSVALTDCEVTGNMSNTYNGDSDENIHCIMIYQSMSGDADVGEATFSAEGGSITAKTGDMFYITNTDCEITLKDVAFTLANDVFLRVEGNSSSRGWGTEGANGGDVTLTADSQEFAGNILVDEISSLALTMKNGTSYEGAINPDGDGGTVDVTLDDDSTWTLTGDSYITSFDGDTSNITANGYHLYVNGEQVL